MVRRGLGIVGRLMWRAGVRSRYRRLFWKMALPKLRKGQIEAIIQIGTVGYHLIRFAEECAAGKGEKCFYAPAP